MLTAIRVHAVFLFLWLAALVAGAQSRPQAPPPTAPALQPTLVLISGEFEYESAKTLPEFKTWLEARYPLHCVCLERTKGEDIPGLEALDSADLAILFIRRMTLPPEQLAHFKKYVESGKPLIALRTSSHAFENWKEFDRDVLGGNYHSHYDAGLAASAKAAADATSHPILRGIGAAFALGGSLYKTSPLAPGTTLLVTGSVTGEPPEPVAWTNAHNGARVFYTSLGHPKDFEAGPLKEMLVNAIYWGLNRDAPPPGGRGLPAPIKDNVAGDRGQKPPPTSGPLSPADAIARMTLPPGFRVGCFSSEPDVRQPVALNWDDRGRLWVVEYLQYPHPAGLKALEWDSYFRTKYDRVPEPPPKGPRGADRIRIFEDTDGDGRADKIATFVDGLNIATGVAVGHGGVYVANAPYLLFYPDRDADDHPDGPPEVLLEGFGLEDTHAVVNSLHFGPDGWLYGAQGSTCTARVRGHTFQQAVWRYRPRTKAFEVFAEGGGNTWSFDWDAEGHLACGTNWGSYAFLHLVQGGYYVKNFQKHGELTNPYSFGYFDHAAHKGEFKGGHITIGGLFYQADAFPPEFRGKHIAANILSNAIYTFDVERAGSSFATRQGPDLLVAHDERFRPVAMTVGPDGALYVADWYDLRSTHNTTRDDTWDKSTGRIYRITYGEPKPAPRIQLSKLPSAELVKLLDHPNEWYPREAQRILAGRRDASVVPALREAILGAKDPHMALESLWALYVSGGFDEDVARKLLTHPAPAVRTWTVRFLGDAGRVSEETAKVLESLTRHDRTPDVRSQLAATARFLPSAEALPVISGLIQGTGFPGPGDGRIHVMKEDGQLVWLAAESELQSADADDPQIPLLVWWAIEHQLDATRDRLVDLLIEREVWKSALARQHLLERLVRRLASTGTDADFAACAKLLASAPNGAGADLVLHGMELGLAGRRLERVPEALAGPLGALWTKQQASPGSGTKVPPHQNEEGSSQKRPSPALVRLAALAGHAPARARVLEVARDAKAKPEDRAVMVRLLGQIGGPEAQKGLLELLDRDEPEAVAAEVVTALGVFNDAAVADALLARLTSLNATLKARTVDLLAGRRDWAMKLVAALGPDIRRQPLALVQKLMQLRDPALDAAVEKAWGRVRATAAEKEETINRLYGVIGPPALFDRPERGVDRAKGKTVFQKKCAVCHTLFGDGAKIGPDLTGANRGDVQWLLRNIVDPSASIRGEYVASVVTLKDGRVLSGFVQDATPQSFTVLDAKGERTAVARADVEESAEMQTSLMPEGLLDDLDGRQLVDLYAYLMSGGK